MTRTKPAEWQDTPKAMVAAVTNIAMLVCRERSIGFVPAPQRREVWLLNNDLNVSARNRNEDDRILAASMLVPSLLNAEAGLDFDPLLFLLDLPGENTVADEVAEIDRLFLRPRLPPGRLPLRFRR